MRPQVTNTLPQLLSVGHSNHELARFVELLRGARVTAVADVRSQPSSQRLPQFNGPELQRALSDAGIAYVFLGDQLGGRPDRPSLYDEEGRADYWRMRATAEFRRGLDRLCEGMASHTIAMLCAEEDPLDCHRGLMIAPALAERGVATSHLRGDGRIETAVQFESRLLAETKVGAGIVDGLFAAEISANERREILDEALRCQARRKAFRARAADETADDDSTDAA
jgi:uncharacterized protein (DUF488 family)